MSTSTSPFLDVNVWLALASEVHPHHQAAAVWAASVPPAENFILSRFTQLGLLRLLTNRGAMGVDVLTLVDAWAAFDRISDYWGAVLLEEPTEFAVEFRALTMRDEVSPQRWADAYLSAFALGHRLTLVTFDKALARSVGGAVLLKT